MKPKTEQFKIPGWGVIEFESEGIWQCGGATGMAVQIVGEAGGTMDFKECRKLMNFLRRRLATYDPGKRP